MFTVGEFSRLAQVSKRLLRYYDEIDLLKPNHTDKFTDYRYYSAAQLLDLNRILALKELGLSLEQIRRILRDKISTEELQGMLLLKKAESEQQLLAERQRIDNIESRLQFIRNADRNEALDVIVKQVPAMLVLSVRTVVESFEAGMGLFGQVLYALPAKSPYGLPFGIWHGDGIDERSIDVEIGRVLTTPSHAPVTLGEGLQLTLRELPAVDAMATFVLRGSTEHAHLGYSAIGTWAEINGYRLVGAPREVALHLAQTADRSDGITEIQFPIEALDAR